MITIRVCALPLATCTMANAINVIRVVNEAAICPGMQAQARLASTTLGRDLRSGEAIKIECKR